MKSSSVLFHKAGYKRLCRLHATTAYVRARVPSQSARKDNMGERARSGTDVRLRFLRCRLRAPSLRGVDRGRQGQAAGWTRTSRRTILLTRRASLSGLNGGLGARVPVALRLSLCPPAMARTLLVDCLLPRDSINARYSGLKRATGRMRRPSPDHKRGLPAARTGATVLNIGLALCHPD